jgi:hypothetical protein
MVHFIIPSRPKPVYLQKARLLVLLDYARSHPQSYQWIGPLTLLLEREGHDG